jgi:crotonobetainyl-CoA:carnitine CoA-transferase CaiB-like acyl-CoA transferase
VTDIKSLFDRVRVLDISTLFAGPIAATLLADYGAEVIKVEHPRGDDLRTWGEKKNGLSMWWKVYSRNKKLISVDLNHEEGRKVILKLLADADVLIENFRPGRMDYWGLSYETLSSLNPRLIEVSVTGFGQSGPYSDLPGFGTIAEAMSGFANINGYSEGPPTLPPMPLADGVAGITAAFAIAGSLFRREKCGEGERIDLALYEPLMWIIGPQISENQQMGTIHGRRGNQSNITSPRNIYMTRDGRWVALSASAQTIVERLFRCIGRPDLIEDPRFRTNTDRLKNRDELDEIITSWTRERDQEEIVKIFRANQVAIAPVYDTSQLSKDEHFRERGSILSVNDPNFGHILMQGLITKLAKHGGKVGYPGKEHIGEDTIDVLLDAGYTKEEIARMSEIGAIKYYEKPM